MLLEKTSMKDAPPVFLQVIVLFSICGRFRRVLFSVAFRFVSYFRLDSCDAIMLTDWDGQKRRCILELDFNSLKSKMLHNPLY